MRHITVRATPSVRRLLLLGVAATGAVVAVTIGPVGGAEVAAAAPAIAREPAGSAASASGDATARLLFAGDVMLGRGVAPLAAADPAGLVAGIRTAVSAADLAVANLESPLTVRPHDPALGPNALEATPASAEILALAGFDAVGIANNHAGDAGPRTVPDTIGALSRAGIAALGAGRSAARAYAPRIVRVDGLRVALLAFDATGQGPRAGSRTPGVATWDETLARRAVRRARAQADVVAVGVHGGLEYAPTTDPYLMRLARRLASWGADIVWGQGAHVVQPIRVLGGTQGGRPAIVATSLGNLVFDQYVPGTRRGAILEVLVGGDGVRAFRIGSADATAPVRFLGWKPPRGDAVALGGEWWNLARPVTPVPVRRPGSLPGFEGEVVDAALGDPVGTGGEQLVVAFRRPFRPTNVSTLVPRSRLVDRHGLAAHVGVYGPRDLRPLWVAGTLFRPVRAVAACQGSIAVAYSGLDSAVIVGTGAWRWAGFGFLTLPELPGRGVVACANVAGRLDPVVLERSSE
jgi:poly-gamma-glutamate synthesis protein (capsule biosynthesis protein)